MISLDFAPRSPLRGKAIRFLAGPDALTMWSAPSSFDASWDPPTRFAVDRDQPLRATIIGLGYIVRASPESAPGTPRASAPSTADECNHVKGFRWEAIEISPANPADCLASSDGWPSGSSPPHKVTAHRDHHDIHQKRCFRFRVCRGSESDSKYEPIVSMFHPILLPSVTSGAWGKAGFRRDPRSRGIASTADTKMYHF